MQLPRALVVIVLAAVLALAGWWAWRLWREPQLREPIRTLPAPTPWLGDPVGQVVLEGDAPWPDDDSADAPLRAALEADTLAVLAAEDSKAGEGALSAGAAASVPAGMQPVCGAEPLPARQPRQPQWPAPDEVPGLADGLRELSAHLARGDARSRVAGLIIGFEAFRQERLLPRGCPRGDQACTQRRVAAVMQDRAVMGGLAQALYLEAARSTDWAIWSMSMTYCQLAGDPLAACHQLGWRQWAAQEPGNAWPWLMLAESANRVGDAAGVDEALYQVTQSRGIEPHSRELATVLRDPVFDPDNGLAAIAGTYALAEAIARVRAPWGAITTHCRKPDLDDANRRMRCESLAQVLASSTDASTGVMLGLSVGRRLGWDEQQRRVALQQLRDSQAQTRELRQLTRRQPLGCQTARGVRELLLERAGSSPDPAPTPPR